MRACHQVEIVTPRGFLLYGLWFGPLKPRRVFVLVHGLGSSMFSRLKIADYLLGRDTAVLSFNNRGHDKVSHTVKARTRKKASVRGGAAHEVFTDCADDIQGAVNFARKRARETYLIGHSTGCQKSVYWAHKKGRGVRGIVLLAPISDYAATVMLDGKQKIVKAERAARTLVHRGKKHELLPESVWSWELLADAQRFLSLYTPDSAEEMFLYSQPKKNPRIVKSLRVPALVLLAEKDEYGDRSAKKIAEWFGKHIRARKSAIRIVSGVPHSFKGGERNVARIIRDWVGKL
jgi:alpha-beta hydrolase superfamily lysophospholipase